MEEAGILSHAFIQTALKNNTKPEREKMSKFKMPDMVQLGDFTAFFELSPFELVVEGDEIYCQAEGSMSVEYTYLAEKGDLINPPDYESVNVGEYKVKAWLEGGFLTVTDVSEDEEIFSINAEGKPVWAEGFIKKLE